MATATENGKATGVVFIPAIQEKTIRVEIGGLSPLIVHRFSEKAKREMLDKQRGAAKQKKEAKDPERDFRESLYVVPGREDMADGEAGKYFFPAKAFKACGIGACRFLGKDVPMTVARGAFFVTPDSVFGDDPDGGPILRFSELAMREDVVKIGMGTSDLRYRGQFNDWSATLEISFDATVISVDQLVNLLNAGGYHVGVGEWRPSSKSGGEYGRFRVTGVEG